jgi:hypothetical protein
VMRWWPVYRAVLTAFAADRTHRIEKVFGLSWWRYFLALSLSFVIALLSSVVSR